MKKLMFLLLCAAMSCVIISCKDDKEKGDPPPYCVLETSTISAKWIVEGQDACQSIELNESGHYIIHSSGNYPNSYAGVHFGTYIIDMDRIILPGFGVLTVMDIDSKTLIGQLAITYTSEAIVIKGKKQEEENLSERTKMLCRTWKMTALDGNEKSDIIIILTRTGTYLLSYDEQRFHTAQWAWKDESEEAFVLTGYSEAGIQAQRIESIVSELTKDKLVIIEVLEYLDDQRAEFKPVSGELFPGLPE